MRSADDNRLSRAAPGELLPFGDHGLKREVGVLIDGRRSSRWTSVLASCSSPIAGSSITLPRRSLARSSATVSRNPPAFAVAENNASPNRLRPRHVGRVEARAEQNLGLADALKGSHDGAAVRLVPADHRTQRRHGAASADDDPAHRRNAFSSPSAVESDRISVMAITKARVLTFVRDEGPVGSWEVAAALGYTIPGAASTLLRLHRHGHLRRQREGQAFRYTLSEKGEGYLRFVTQGRS